jgi:hypothetical protein
MPSFCNVLFFSTSKKLRRAFEEETAKRNFLFVRDLNFNPIFLLSPSIIKARRAWTDLWFGMTKI